MVTITLTSRMNFFLEMQNGRIWNAMEFRWSPTMLVHKNGRFTIEIKPKQEWDRVDNKTNEVDANAIYCIFNDVILMSFTR